MPLTAPVLTAGPADGSTDTDTTPTFSWSAVAGASGYKVSVDGSGSSSSGAPSQIGVMIFENESGTAVATDNAPTLHALQAQYRDYSNLFATTHPSLPNYCAFSSGSWLGQVGNDTNVVNFAGSAPNIMHQLQLAGKSWKAYEEGVTGFYGAWAHSAAPNHFAARHCPAAFYSTTSAAGTSHGNGRYDFNELLFDMTNSSLPDFFFLTPNLDNDGHDTDVPFADRWLAGQNPDNSTFPFPGIDALIAAMRPDGVLFLTFDEGSGTGAGQRIYTVAVGQRVTHDVVSTSQTHWSFLYGIQQAFGQQKFAETGQNLNSAYTSLSAGIPIPQTGSAGTGGIDLGTTRTYTPSALSLGGHDFQAWAYDGSGDGPHTTVDWQVSATSAPAVIPTVQVIQENPAWDISDKEIGRVDAICYDPSQNILYVGGNFHGTNSVQEKGGTKRSIDYLFAIDWATQELIPTWLPQPNGRVYSIYVSPNGGRVYVGGAFTSIGSTPVTMHNLACLNAATGGNTGTVATTRMADLGFNGVVHRLKATADGLTLFAGGDFTAPATTGLRLSKIDLSPTLAALVQTWKPSTNGHVRALALDLASNRLVVGGDFTTVNGATKNSLACIRQDGNGETLSFAYQPGDRVLDAATDGTNVYFGTVNDLLVKCDFATGTQQWGNKAEDTDGNVQAVCINRPDSSTVNVVGGMHGDCIGNAVGAASGSYSGGSCGVATGVVRHKVWRQTAASGALDNAWDPSLTSTAGVLGVWALESYQDQVWMGGDFTKVQGATRQRLSAFGVVFDPGNGNGGGTITQRAGYGFGEGTTAASASPPAGYQSGDMLVAHLTAVGASALVAPAGWTPAAPITNDGTAVASCVYTKLAAATESPSMFSCAGATSLTVYVTAWQGAASVRASIASASSGANAVTLTSPALSALVANDEVLTFASTSAGPRPYPDSGGLVVGAMDAPTDWSTQTGIAAIETVAGRKLAAAHSMVPWDCHVGAANGDFTGGAKAPAVDFAQNRLTYVSWPRPRAGANLSESSWTSVFGTTDPVTVLNAIAAGTHDGIIDGNAAAYAAFKHPIIIRLLWESNGGGLIWGIGKSSQQANYNAAYKAACQRIVARTRAVAKNVQFHWNPQNFQTVAGSAGNRDNQYWGDASTDYAGTEGYLSPGDTFPSLMTNTSSNGQTYTAIYSGYGLGSGHAKLLGNGEGGNRYQGTADTTAAAARIDSLRTGLPQFPDWRFYMWWNANGSNGNSDITAQPTACKTAFASWLAQAYTTKRLNRSWKPLPQTQVYEDRRTLGTVGTCYGAGQQGATLVHTTQAADGASSPVTFPTYGYGAHTAIQVALSSDVVGPPPPPPPGGTLNDTFTRTTASGWGTSDDGFAWTHVQGTVSEVSTDGTTGVLTFTSAGDVKREALTPTAGVDFTTTEATSLVTFDAAPSGSDFHHGIMFRYQDTANYYRLSCKVGNTVVDRAQLTTIVGGVATDLHTQVSLGTDFFVPGDTYAYRIQCDIGGAMRCKVWNTSGAEPGAWLVDLVAPATDPLTHGGLGYRVQVIGGGAAAPHFQFDDLAVTATPFNPGGGSPPADPTFTATPSDSATPETDGVRWAVAFDTTTTSAERRLQGAGTSDFDDGWQPFPFGANFTASFQLFTVSPFPETLTFSVRASNADGTSGEVSDSWARLDSGGNGNGGGTNLGGPTSQWLYVAPNYVGCQWGVGPGPQKTKAAETFAHRNFYIRTQGDGEAAFNPTGRNQAGSLVEAPVDWSNDFADMAGTGTDLTHTADVIFTIIGKRSADLTWPASVGGDPWGAFSAWTYGDGSYVDLCITRWSDLIKTVPRASIGRMWHEFGNATSTYGQGTPAQMVLYWKKVVQRLRDLGALTLDPTDKTNEQMRIAWNPASHLNNPNDDASHHPGNAWVDVNLLDLYFKPAVGGTSLTLFDAYYNSWNPINGTKNPEKRPMGLAEHGFDMAFADRTSLFNQWLGLLKTRYRGVNFIMWWDGSGNDVTDNPVGFQQAWINGLADPYFLPDGLVVDTGGPPPPPNSPTVTVQQPVSGTTITGSSVNVSASASEVGGGISAVTMSVNNGAAQALSASSVDAQGNGTYVGTATLTTAASPGAANTIKVTATDRQLPAQSTTSSTVTVNAVTVVTDTTGPTLTINNPAGGADAAVEGVNGTTYVVSGVVTDPSGVRSLVVAFGGNHTRPVAGDGSFSYTATLATGANAFTVTATDNSPAQNQTVTSFTITLSNPVNPDVVPPTLVVTTPAADLTIAGTAGDSYAVQGTATDPSGISSLTVNGAVVSVAGNGSFSRSIVLAAGANTVIVIAIDAAAALNSVTVTRTVTLVSTLGPTLVVTQPVSGSVITADDGYLLQVTGTATGANGVGLLTVNGVATPLASDGSFSQIVSLTIGANQITVVAVDTQVVPQQTQVSLLVTLAEPTVIDSGGFLTSLDQARIQAELQDRGVE